jgi:hypothetical protein
MDCIKCGEPMRMTEKDTSSGRDIREYTCDRCGHSDWEDSGKALWQILSDDREELEAARAGHTPAEIAVLQPEVLEPHAEPAASLWRRLLALFRRGK